MITLKGVGQIPTRKLVGIARVAMLAGGCYAVDVTRIDAASTDADTSLTNFVATATANLRGQLVIADKAAAVGEQVTVTLEGRVNALVDGGTIDVTPGLVLIAQNASPNLIAQSTGVAGCPGIGLALGTNTSATAALVDVWFSGDEIWKCPA